MLKPVLSKSTYIRSLQCLKSLYLYKNYFLQRDKVSVEQQAIFNRGHAVGNLAHQLFPGGVDASKGVKQRSKDALLRTLDLIQKGEKIIYEASFQHDGVWVIADIIVLQESGYKVYEVKSSLSISDTYMNDAALQFHVISNALKQINNLELLDFVLVYVNKNYVLKGAFDVKRYFLFREMKAYCEEQNDFVQSRIIKAKLTLDNGKIPAVDTGEHCFNPYPCDFQGTCFKNTSKPEALQVNNLDLNSFFNSDEKVNVLDWLTTRPAIPMFDGMQPYQTIVFQFSIADINNTKNTFQFVAENSGNPNTIFMEQLIKNTINPGAILVSDYTSKCNVLQELAEFYPQYAAPLSVIKQRLKPITDFFISDEKPVSMAAINQLLEIKTIESKDLVKNKTEAAEAFIEMQQANDLFKNMELSDALNHFGKSNISKLLDIIEQLKNVSKSVITNS